MTKLRIDHFNHLASANKTATNIQKLSKRSVQFRCTKSISIKRDTASRPLKTIPSDCEKIHNCVEREREREREKLQKIRKEDKEIKPRMEQNERKKEIKEGRRIVERK